MPITNPATTPSPGWMGNPARGASMGRSSVHSDDRSLPRRFSLQQVRLDSGGYDQGGAYWGHHQRLYWAGSADGEVSIFFRAVDRAAAKDEVRADYPNATFYR